MSDSPWVNDGVGHPVVDLPLAVVLYVAVRWWPPARQTRPGRLARRLVLPQFVAALSLMGAPTG